MPFEKVITGAVGRNTQQLFGGKFYIPGIGWVKLTDKGSMGPKGPPGIDIAVSNRQQMFDPRFNRRVNVGGQDVKLTAYIAGHPELDPAGGGGLDAFGHPVVPFQGVPRSRPSATPFKTPLPHRQASVGETNIYGQPLFDATGQPINPTMPEVAPDAPSTPAPTPPPGTSGSQFEPYSSPSIEPTSTPGEPTSTWQDYLPEGTYPGIGEPFVGNEPGNATPLVEVWGPGESPGAAPYQTETPTTEANTGYAPATFGEFSQGGGLIPSNVNFQGEVGGQPEPGASQAFDPNTPAFADTPVDQQLPTSTESPPPGEAFANLPVSPLSQTPTVPLEGQTAAPQDVYYMPDPNGGYQTIDVNTGEVVGNLPGSTLSTEPDTGLPQGPSSFPSDTSFSEAPSVLGDNFQTINALGFDPSQSQDFSPDLVISPGVGGPLSDANLLPGALFGIGQGGGGNLGTWVPEKNMWFGKRPYTAQNFRNAIAWQNSQGNALAGANFYPSQTPGPVTYQPTSGGNYQTYLNQWNAIQAGAGASGAAGETSGGGTKGPGHVAITSPR